MLKPKAKVSENQRFSVSSIGKATIIGLQHWQSDDFDIGKALIFGFWHQSAWEKRRISRKSTNFDVKIKDFRSPASEKQRLSVPDVGKAMIFSLRRRKSIDWRLPVSEKRRCTSFWYRKSIDFLSLASEKQRLSVSGNQFQR